MKRATAIERSTVTEKTRRLLRLLALAAGAGAAACSGAAEWQPAETVEIVVGAGPGGGNDNTARTMQRLLTEKKLVVSPISVINKPGGGGSIALHYLNQRAGKGNFLGASSNTMLTNHITKKSPLNFTDLTPISILINEYIAFTVMPDSPLKTAKDLVSRLQADPSSVVVGISTSVGNINHIAFASVARAVGADPRKAKVVVFDSSGASLTALMGGHVDVVTGPTSISAKFLASNSMRALAVTSPTRRTGVFAGVPAWKELGVDAIVDNWRGIVGPRGMTPAQVAYWDATLAKLFQMEEWKKDVEANYWDNAAMSSKDSERYLKGQYEELQRNLAALDLVK